MNTVAFFVGRLPHSTWAPFTVGAAGVPPMLIVALSRLSTVAVETRPAAS
jgi:hypothetical protein